MTETQLLLGAVTALAGVVGLLWARYEYGNARTVKRLEDCEKDRADLWRHLAWAASPCRPANDPATKREGPAG